MRRTIWNPTFAWLGAGSAALVLALVAPTDSNFLGRLPTLAAKRLDQRPMVLPQGLPAERSLALVAFQRDQRGEVDSWIQGLRLDQDKSIAWFRLPVLNDPGDQQTRADLENRLLARHPGDSDRARVVPLFTDRAAFIRAAGLTSTDHAWVLVLNRDGKVLARAEGGFDEDKAQALRETLMAPRTEFR